MSLQIYIIKQQVKLKREEIRFSRLYEGISSRVMAEFALRNIKVASSIVNRGGKTFIRKAYRRKQDISTLVKTATGVADSSATRAIKKTLATGEIPSRKELLSVIGEETQKFIKAPRRTIREGFEREKLAREIIKETTGKDLTKATATQAAAKESFKKAKELGKKLYDAKLVDKAGREDLITNTGGFLGSQGGAVIGGTIGSIGGPLGTIVGAKAGQLAGDLGGAVAVRKTLRDIDATRKAFEKLADDSAFKAANGLQKLKKLRNASLEELRKLAEEGRIADDTTKDIGGWTIGNTVAETVPLPIPFKGAIAAGLAEADVVDASRRIRNGESFLDVIKEKTQKIIKDRIAKGNERERKVRERFSKRYKQLFKPKGIRENG
jgi:hypothetical protein